MKLRMLLLSTMILVTAGIFVISCGKSSSGYNSNPGGGTPPPPPAGNSVSIKDMAFSPATLNVTAGTTVTWTNNDAMTHTVTADDASFDSGNVAAGATYHAQIYCCGNRLIPLQNSCGYDRFRCS